MCVLKYASPESKREISIKLDGVSCAMISCTAQKHRRSL